MATLKTERMFEWQVPHCNYGNFLLMNDIYIIYAYKKPNRSEIDDVTL